MGDDSVDVVLSAVSAFEVSDFVVHGSACFACQYYLPFSHESPLGRNIFVNYSFLEIVLLRSQTFNWGEHIGVVRLHSFIYLEVLLKWKSAFY